MLLKSDDAPPKYMTLDQIGVEFPTIPRPSLILDETNASNTSTNTSLNSHSIANKSAATTTTNQNQNEIDGWSESFFDDEDDFDDLSNSDLFDYDGDEFDDPNDQISSATNLKSTTNTTATTQNENNTLVTPKKEKKSKKQQQVVVPSQPTDDSIMDGEEDEDMLDFDSDGAGENDNDSNSNANGKPNKPKQTRTKRRKDLSVGELQSRISKFAQSIDHDLKCFVVEDLKTVLCTLCEKTVILNKLGALNHLRRHVKGNNKQQKHSRHMVRYYEWREQVNKGLDPNAAISPTKKPKPKPKRKAPNAKDSDGEVRRISKRQKKNPTEENANNNSTTMTTTTESTDTMNNTTNLISSLPPPLIKTEDIAIEAFESFEDANNILMVRSEE